MSLKVPKKPETLDDVHKTLMDFHDNFQIQDLKPGEVETSVPTTETIDKGRSKVVEISGVPRLYHRGTNGTIYILATGVAI